jgi:hypothetical protein
MLRAAAEVDPERHAFEAADQRGLDDNRSRQVGLRIFATVAHRDQRRTIRIGGEARRIDVDVNGSQRRPNP